MTIRNTFPELGPIRYIHEADIEKPFSNRLQKKNGVDLPLLLTKNIGIRHCLVFEGEKEDILAFLVVDDFGDHFYLNLVENNEGLPNECEKRNPAPKLIDRAEDLARSRNHTRIELESLPPLKLVQYYVRLGYREIGTSYHPVYGKLIVMEKNL